MAPRDEVYDAVLERVRELYEGKIIEKLYDIKEACERRQLVCCDPQDFTGDEFGWIMSVYFDDELNDGASVEIKILEERGYDGGTGFGINFQVAITSTEGVDLGGVTPNNYTEEVWVDARDDSAIEKRWELIAGLDNFPIPNLIIGE